MPVCLRHSLRLYAAGLFTCIATLGACAPRIAPKSPGATPAPAGPASAAPARPSAAPPATAPATPSPPQPALRLEFSAAARGITESSIRGHMEFLASDALNGRGSGTRDEWIAATYIASAFRRWGLEPMGDDGGYVQTVEMSRAEATAPPVLTAGSLRATHGKEMVVQTLGSPATISGLLQKFSPGTAVADGAILLMPEEATNADRAAASRAGLILSIESAQARASWDAASARVVAGPSRPIKFLASAAPVATRVFLDKATYAALQAMPAGAPVSFAAAIRSSQPSAFTWNAVAKMTGSDVTASREVIVLSAHLDHLGRPATAAGADAIFNGADDDASGTVAVMELAEALARGPRPKRTLVFALFGSEESGGAGAGYFVNLPVVPLAQIVADLQFEMLGRPDEKVAQHTLWLTGYSLSNLGPELARQGARLVDDPHPDQSFFTRSDNIRFARRGIIAHTVSSFNLHADYHRASDEVKTIDFAHMTDAIRSMLEPMRSLANSSFRPTWIAGGCPAPCR